MSLIQESKPEFDRTVEFLETELHGIRSGRAHASLVEDVSVEAYDGHMPMKNIASISVPDPKTIQIEPWDKDLAKAVEKALIVADLGMQPNVAGAIIRLSMPPMTEENRQRQVKQVHEKAEQAKIRIRNLRESVRDSIQKKEKAKEISEDEKYRLQDDLDKLVKEYNERIESLAERKEQEVLTV
ncbi:ribosome recycling factor [Patescibacteria group bacterium]|jgi:ribosome recycling factor|uniref:Ribosome-recycling factor n=1 Tax=candidate division WWE3 bacterium TaxID=2053526 RepID=A0A928TPQ0_UNCKA|nr:ribosome recycling factor [candidate division WWE3 bacterium]MCL4733060.1 ribosome recycling factor [Patescibacteria group bacterium]MDL1953315.1 ribosome recycling factor [Candidatus Uhrbacteria bacterium UHB]RIL00544.1 MAG: ribosome recycling factor [Candidatus Uhrbacteria bacterium]